MDKAKELMAKMSGKSSGRVIKARLTKKGQGRLKQFAKQAQGMVDDIEVGKKSFPDATVRKAMRNLISSIEDNLEAVMEVAEAAGESEIVDVIEDAVEDLSALNDIEHSSDTDDLVDDVEDEEDEEDEVEIEIDMDDDFDDSEEVVFDETKMNE